MLPLARLRHQPLRYAKQVACGPGAWGIGVQRCCLVADDVSLASLMAFDVVVVVQYGHCLMAILCLVMVV